MYPRVEAMNDCVISSKKLKYEGLVDLSKLQELMESFYQVIGVANAVGDLEGKVLAHAGWQSVCTDFHRTNAQTCQRCTESDSSIANGLIKGDTFVVYKCLNGLVDNAAPIVVDGQHIANVFTGQYLTAPPDVEFFRSQAHQFGFDEEDYLEAIGQVPVLPPERVEAITCLFSQFAAMLAMNSFDKFKHLRASEDLTLLNKEFETRVASRTEASTASEEHLRLALLTARQGCFDLDIRTGEIGVSPEYAQLLGYDPGEFQSDFKNWLDNIHQDDRPAVSAAFQLALASSEVAEMSYRRQTKAGDWIWINSVGKVVEWDSEGKPVRMIGIHADITERKQAELTLAHERNVLRTLIDTLPNLIWLKDSQGVFLSCNQRVEHLLGAPEADIVGKTDYDFVSKELADSFRQNDRVAMEKGGPSINEEEVSYASDGHHELLETTKVPMRDASGELIGVLGISHDITERVAVAAELDQYRHHLEHLVEERTTALSIAKEAAEAASRAKSTFLANMGHELRTPMNHIMGMTELARLEATDPKQIDHLNKVSQASNKLLAIINSLLDISKIESEQLTLDRVEFTLGSVIDSISGLTQPDAQKKGLRLCIEIAPELAQLPLQGDPLRLGQILLNLTSNAIKFTAAGSVTLMVAMAEETPEAIRLRVEVTDTGIGISAEDQKRLFTAFEQADSSTTRKYGGTGLGLVISKHLVRAMEGDIGVDSQSRAGSTFWFSARLDKHARDMDAAPVVVGPLVKEQLKAHYSGVRILLVEDEPVGQEFVKTMLEDIGLVIDLAEDGVQAVEMSKQTDYALILMDMRMPRLNGVDATKSIRMLPGREKTPIVATTANAFADDRKLCLDAGMNDFISKPFRPDDLFAIILKWLAQGNRH